MNILQKMIRFHFLPNTSMTKKISVVFVFLIMIPMVILSYVSYESYSKNLQENTILYVSEISDKMLKRLDDDIDGMMKLSATPAYLGELQELLMLSNQSASESKRAEDRAAETELKSNIGLFAQMINNMKNETNSVYIFDNDGRVYMDVKTRGARADLDARYEEWLESARKAGGQAILFSTQDIINDYDPERYVFTVVRDIKEVFTRESVGMIAIDANISMIEEVVMDLDLTTKGKTILLDSMNKVIFDSERKLITQDFSRHEVLAEMNEAKGSFSAMINGAEHLVVYTSSKRNGWKMVVTVPLVELTEKVAEIQRVMIIITTSIIGLALFILMVVTFAITNPLRKLIELMKEVQNGNLDVRFHVKYNDEVGMLGRHFNEMLNRIKQLIRDVYQVELKKKEIELDALQSQINPHFIYNSLESIRMNAEINDDDETADMIFLLSKLLRYSINRGNERVTLHEEIDHLDHYVKFLNFRFHHSIVLQVQPLDKICKMEVIKLLFQPIVENAILHGVGSREEPLLISITYEMFEEKVVFSIKDNGSGMQPEKVEELQQKISRGVMLSHHQQPDEHRKSGLGLRNVNERIKIYYGTEYGLSIQSEVGKGTEVFLSLPYNKRRENRDD